MAALSQTHLTKRPETKVADLTSQTFVEAIKSAGSFQGRGTPTASLFAVARRVYANPGTGAVGRLRRGTGGAVGGGESNPQVPGWGSRTRS
jgi:hypothetical protein